ncbi:MULTISPECIES: adenylate/guanylate cyclase domain-containing protein [unclassified Bradyrhizobium]|uniref:adenylate/guanylate cyclase domain-containing protein n=1 Tax=unclassified Bradyrhizobium TaxID=2631580 RepID=UPI001FFAD0F5|nr:MULTISPECIES: adenylate/guanylate cyclase domain-containing protein [unclassified Bradyrhizobium]
MNNPPITRRLAAIMAADVAGYSRLMSADEEATLQTLDGYRRTISDLIAEHAGRVFGTAGDSVIAEFSSAVQAVRAAVAIQRSLDRHNADLPQDRRMEFRIGINVGDVMADGDDVLGDGVNVAARLEGVAEPGGICISGTVRDQIEGKLNFALTPLGQRSLKNISRPVSVYSVDWQPEHPVSTGILGGSLALPDKPSIAVLPFSNMSGDPEQEYFADGITEDIITALSHNRWFFVIARNSTFVYKGRAVDVKQVARELGVRYVLEGSVRRAGQRVRITGQLIEAQTGNHLWAERFDRDLADIFAIQDEITQSVVGAIEPEMLLIEGRRAFRKSVRNLDAFDCCMRAMWHFSQLAPEEHEEAITLIRQALALDPNLAQAHMTLARTLNARIWYGWSSDLTKDVSDIYTAAARAVALDDRDPYCHYALCWASLLRQMHSQALAEAQRSIDLNPNFALGFFSLGLVRVHIGHFTEALDSLLRSLRLNPNDPQAGSFLSFVALAHYHQENYEEAVHYGELAIQLRRPYLALRALLASLGQLGRIEEAQPLLQEFISRQPKDPRRQFEITTPYLDLRYREHLADGLSRAGVTNLR